MRNPPQLREIPELDAENGIFADNPSCRCIPAKENFGPLL
jgi:hypothetical protein